MNSKRFFISFCLLTTFSLASVPLNASVVSDDGEEKRSKARASSSAEKKEADPFEAYSVTLRQFSSSKNPFELSVSELTGLLEATKPGVSEVLAQDKKNLYRIQLSCVKELRVKDLKEGDQITPLLDSQSMSFFETTDLPYVVMRDGRVNLNFRLMISTQSKKEFLSAMRSKKKINTHLTGSSKDKVKLLELQAEQYADLLPIHFKRQLKLGESMLEDFEPKLVNHVPIKMFEAFLGDGIGSFGSLYSKTLMLDGGFLLTFSSKTLSKLEMVDQTDLLSYLGYSLSKKKRRNGEMSNAAMTFHYEVAKASSIIMKKGYISDALPTPSEPHLFDLTIKRAEETPDISKDELSLITSSPIVLPARASYARFKASSGAQLGEPSGRPRSRSFSTEDLDFDKIAMEGEKETDRKKTAPIPIKKEKALESQSHSSEEGGSVDDDVWNAHSFVMTSLQQHLEGSGRTNVKSFKPRVEYKRASSVQNLGSKQSLRKGSNHNGVTSPRYVAKLATSPEEVEDVMENLESLTLSDQPSSSDTSGLSLKKMPRKRCGAAKDKKITVSGSSSESKGETPKSPGASD
jgi:hypothetical protein